MVDHLLIAANQEDAMDYIDSQYTVVKYIGDSLEGIRVDECSFTPRATNMPHWMDDLQMMQANMCKYPGDWRGNIHYINLFED